MNTITSDEIAYEEKKNALWKKIEAHTEQDMILAFSGGVDSSLLLKLACICAKRKHTKVYAITLHTMLHPAVDMENAKQIAAFEGAEHIILEVDELQHAGILDNPVDRCYRCKKYLFRKILKEAADLQIKVVLEGTNADDLHVYRPGIKAVQELGIKSPLAEVGFTKAEIRQLAVEYKVHSANRPSTPCLATRFPYGVPLSYSQIQKVNFGENYLRSFGLYNVRLRVHGDIARIEVDVNDQKIVLENRTEIITYLKSLGYKYITMDLEGFRSGSMDIGIKTEGMM